MERERNPKHHFHPAATSGPAALQRRCHAEGSLTRIVEQQTAKIPSAVFLGFGLAALCASAVLELLERPRLARLAGLCTPALLITGVYNKLVKSLGPL